MYFKVDVNVSFRILWLIWILLVIIYTKKFLNSDWLRKEYSSSVTRVQTCNTSAKLVTRVQITNGFWLAENTKETTKNQSD